MKKEKGFSLLDVLIALLILGFMLLSIAQLLLTAVKSENAARHQTTYLFYGQQYMEDLLNSPDTDPRLSLYIVPKSSNANCAVSDKLEQNIYCFDWKLIDANHKYAAFPDTNLSPGKNYYFLAWSVQELYAGGPRAITLYVVPFPQEISAYKVPIVLSGIYSP